MQVNEGHREFENTDDYRYCYTCKNFLCPECFENKHKQLIIFGYSNVIFSFFQKML